MTIVTHIKEKQQTANLNVTARKWKRLSYTAIRLMFSKDHWEKIESMFKEDIITFGNYNWRILDIQDDRALIITEDIIELRWYRSDFVDITWADCH